MCNSRVSKYPQMDFSECINHQNTSKIHQNLWCIKMVFNNGSKIRFSGPSKGNSRNLTVMLFETKFLTWLFTREEIFAGKTKKSWNFWQKFWDFRNFEFFWDFEFFEILNHSRFCAFRILSFRDFQPSRFCFFEILLQCQKRHSPFRGSNDGVIFPWGKRTFLTLHPLFLWPFHIFVSMGKLGEMVNKRSLK